jgi:arylsulfatase
MGIADNTFVQYSTDNGPHCNSWPDAGTTPFRSEKNSNWEGAFRVPMLVRWPGRIKPGSISNEIVQHHDWLPTFLEMAGAPDVVEKLKKGYKAIGRTYKNHIDGYSMLGYLTEGKGESPRRSSSTSVTTATCSAIASRTTRRSSSEQRSQGTLGLWFEPFTKLRGAKIFNLRTDPFEFADYHLKHLLGLGDSSCLGTVRRAGARRQVR